VIADMDQFGIARRSQEERLTLGRELLAQRRREHRARAETRANELGFADLRAYLIDRIEDRRWRQADVAAELRVPVGRLRDLMRKQGMRPAKRAAPADEPDPDAYQRGRLAAAQRALAAHHRARDDAIAKRLGFPDIAAWYAARSGAAASTREMMAEAGIGEKWLRRLARDWRQR
jgi:hypothetical protein